MDNSAVGEEESRSTRYLLLGKRWKGSQQALFKAENSLHGPIMQMTSQLGGQEFLPLPLTRLRKLLWAACANRWLMIDVGAFYVTKWKAETGAWFWSWWYTTLVPCKGGILKHLCWLSLSWATQQLVGGMKRSCLVFAFLCSFSQTLKIQQAKRRK